MPQYAYNHNEIIAELFIKAIIFSACLLKEQHTNINIIILSLIQFNTFTAANPSLHAKTTIELAAQSAHIWYALIARRIFSTREYIASVPYIYTTTSGCYRPNVCANGFQSRLWTHLITEWLPRAFARTRYM